MTTTDMNDSEAPDNETHSNDTQGEEKHGPKKPNTKSQGRFKRIMGFLLSAIVVLLVLAVVLKLLFPLPDRDNLPADPAITHESSTLADAVDEITARHPGKTGIHSLPTGIEAFSMRIAMARAAERTIDARYYIWEDDLSGRMLLSEMIDAADRGVRVRILIDDNPTGGLDPMWAAANSHPNIAVRIFNPLVIRKFRPANYLFDFPRLNRRMHNKSMTVDGIAAVVGGRNVGDVYFGAAGEGLFLDLDVVTIGDTVPGVLADFQIYWDAEAAFPADRILSDPQTGKLEELRDPSFDDPDRAAAYSDAAAKAIEEQLMQAPDETLIWADVTMFSDNPIKAQGKSPEADLVATKLAPVLESAQTRFDIVSGYFVPGNFGSDLIAGLANRGVKSRVVTNSIQVTDVPLVHAGYMPYRHKLLEAGVKMYEAKPIKGTKHDTADLGKTRFSGGGESVHAKTFAVDNSKFIVGSFNFDPRSAELNCEMVLIIESPEMAEAFNAVLDERLPESTYAVSLDDGNDLRWTENRGGEQITYDKEPGTSAFERGFVKIMSYLPIQWML